MEVIAASDGLEQGPAEKASLGAEGQLALKEHG